MSIENEIFLRFKKERRRLGLSHARVGEICGVAKTSVIAWERGAKIPAEALATLMREGLDIFYVLAGRDKNAPQPVTLFPQEVSLVDQYRSLSNTAQRELRAYLAAKLESDVRKGTARGVRERKPPEGQAVIKDEKER